MSGMDEKTMKKQKQKKTKKNGMVFQIRVGKVEWRGVGRGKNSIFFSPVSIHFHFISLPRFCAPHFSFLFFFFSLRFYFSIFLFLWIFLFFVFPFFGAEKRMYFKEKNSCNKRQKIDHLFFNFPSQPIDTFFSFLTFFSRIFLTFLKKMLLRICADLHSDKVNLEIPIDLSWTVDKLREMVVGVMDRESELMRPSNVPRNPFRLNQLQIFDDRATSWVEVTDMNLLFEGAQLYAFQPQTTHHRDVQKDLPPARPPSNVGAYTSTRPHASAVPGVTPSYRQEVEVFPHGVRGGVGGGVVYENGRDGATDTEKLAYLFDEMDYHEKGQVSYQDFFSWLRELVDFSEDTFQLLFRSADVHRQGVLSRDQFYCFARRFPNVCEIVFHRAADRWDVTNRDMEARAAGQQVCISLWGDYA